MPRQDDLKQKLADMSMEDAGALDTSRVSLQRVNQEIEEISNKVESMDGKEWGQLGVSTPCVSMRNSVASLTCLAHVNVRC